MTQPNTNPLAQYEQELRDTLVGWRNAVAQIRAAVASDRRIASTAAGEVTAERVNAIRPQWTDVLNAVVSRADSTVADLVQRSIAALPGRDNTLEGILERQATWARWTYWLGRRPDARPQAIFAAASTPEDVHCLAVELPMYLSANGFSDDVTEVITNLAATRLAELAGPAATAALAAADAAELARTRMQATIDHVRNEIQGAIRSGSSTLQAAVTGWADSTAQARRFAGLPPA